MLKLLLPIFLLLLSLGHIFPVFAQKPENVERIEPRQPYNSDTYVIPAHQQGVMTVNKSSLKKNKERYWTLTCYDTALQKSWTKDILMHSKLEYLDHFQKGGLIYLLLNYDDSYSIYTVNLRDGSFTNTAYELPQQKQIKFFKVFNNRGYEQKTFRFSKELIYKI